MKTLRNALPFSIMGFCALGAFYCLYLAANSPSPTPQESAYVNLLLCFLSVVASWIGSHYYAVYSVKHVAEEKIDTIAQQSTEKIMNQSAQLWEVERFLESSVEAAETEPTIQGANNTFRNRVVATAQMIRLLRSSNNTFTSDWAGVASSEVKAKMESQVKKQQELFNIYSEFADFQAANSESGIEGQGQKTPETLKRIEDASKNLPAAALPTNPSTYTKAVTLTQLPTSSSKSEALGTAILRVSRPVDNATGSLKLLPELSAAPDVIVNLVKAPPGVNPEHFKIRAGTPTSCGFCIHLRPSEADLIPVGDYHVTYEAKPLQVDSASAAVGAAVTQASPEQS